MPHENIIRRSYTYNSIRSCLQQFAGNDLSSKRKGVGNTFRNLHCVPRQLYGIKLMLGAELNILNTKGDIDLDEDYWRMLDIRIAGIHSLCWQGGSK